MSEAFPLPTEAETVAQFFDSGQPDWEKIKFEINCPRCGYNVRMLTQPRCPECGLVFEWKHMLDAAAWRSDFLFEHHWRTHPFGSWAKTIARSLRPFRFWRDVSIHDRVEPGPLLFLLITSFLWFMILLHTAAWLTWLAVDSYTTKTTSGTRYYYTYLNLARTMRSLARAPFDSTDYYWLPGGIMLAVLATLILLCSLRQTLGRCRVRTVHILRVVAYASTPFWIAGSILVFTFTSLEAWPVGPGEQVFKIVMQILSMVCLPACLALHLIAGLRNYLKLPRPFILGITATFVGFLSAMTAFVCHLVLKMGGY